MEQIIREVIDQHRQHSVVVREETLIQDLVVALNSRSEWKGKICPDCQTVPNDGSGYCRTRDTFTMPSGFSLRWVRRSETEQRIFTLATKILRAVEAVSVTYLTEDWNKPRLGGAVKFDIVKVIRRICEEEGIEL